MNDPTNATLSLSKYSHHFYQNPNSFPESQQNIVYADEIDYMEIEQGWFQSFCQVILVLNEYLVTKRLGHFGAALPDTRYTSVSVDYQI